MPTLLVIDDDDRIRSLLAEYLSGRGFEVRTAQDGAEGLALLKASPVDLVVLDVMMPNVDGLAVCRQVRATSTVPIVFLSSRDEELDRILGLELGGDDSDGEVAGRIEQLEN